MHLKFTEKGLCVDKVWTPEEFAQYQRLIKERQSVGYYHNIVISDRENKTLQTPGSHMTTAVMLALDKVDFPLNLEGKTVLDIGCNAGFYSTIAKLRGAKRVLGLDVQETYINHALLVRDILGLTEKDIEFKVMDGHDLSPNGEKFDFVINTGVVYHLQNPMDFLCKLAVITKECMFLESEILLDPNFSEYAWFIEKTYENDASNWWIYGPLCLERMARAAGFKHVSFKGYIWKAPREMKTPEGYQRQGRGVFLCQK